MVVELLAHHDAICPTLLVCLGVIARCRRPAVRACRRLHVGRCVGNRERQQSRASRGCARHQRHSHASEDRGTGRSRSRRGATGRDSGVERPRFTAAGRARPVTPAGAADELRLHRAAPGSTVCVLGSAGGVIRDGRADTMGIELRLALQLRGSVGRMGLSARDRRARRRRFPARQSAPRRSSRRSASTRSATADDGLASKLKALIGLQGLGHRRHGLQIAERLDADSGPMIEEQAKVVDNGRLARELPAEVLRRAPVRDAP